MAVHLITCYKKNIELPELLPQSLQQFLLNYDSQKLGGSSFQHTATQAEKDEAEQQRLSYRNSIKQQQHYERQMEEQKRFVENEISES